jgi:hypothetical protein
MNQQMTAGMAGMLCAWLIALPIMLLIAGLLLRVACWISGAAVPPLLYAAFVALLTWLVLAGVTVLAVVGIRFAAAQYRLTRPQLGLAAFLLGFPLHLLVAAAVYCGLLKVGFGKALVIRLAEILIVLIVGVIITALLSWVRGGLGGLGI